MHVLSAEIGGLPVPGLLDGQIENAINGQMVPLGQSALSGSQHYQVTSVSTQSGQLTLNLDPSP
jgi:hypothetical protein